MKKSSNKGFTLVELIIVIAILAIIMLIAIPNFSGIQQRMQVRADKATAAQIGKAVRVWFTDYTTDSTLASGSGKGTILPEKLGIPSGAGAVSSIAEYSTLKGIGEYITTGNRAKSLKDSDGKAIVGGGYYCVFLTANSTDSAAKIAVAITKANNTVANISGITSTSKVDVSYDGNVKVANVEKGISACDGGVAYVEP